MSLLIRGLGTAVPDCQLPQADAEQVGRILCTDRPSQAEMLNVLYRQTGIATRYIVIDRAVVDDVLHHTRHSESVFLARSDRPEGPTTGQRMAEYSQRVLPLALRAAQRALEESAIAPSG
jgi:predicted naringenin-chalcone synthase